MKSDLGISISVSAVVGGALSGLTNIGKAMDTLKSTTKTLSERQKELGKVLERNKDRLGVSSAKQLWQEYDKIGLAVSKLTQQYKKLNAVRAQREAVNSQWGDIKGQWQGALAALNLNRQWLMSKRWLISIRRSNLRKWSGIS